VDFAESAEHRALRAAAAEIARDFGPRYYAERAAERRPCAELWKELAPAGSLVAPMPGLVRRVLVEVGALVVAGQPLLILEAMKMEQAVAAPADGVVAELRAKAGEQVSTGQVLAVVEPCR